MVERETLADDGSKAIGERQRFRHAPTSTTSGLGNRAAEAEHLVRRLEPATGAAALADPDRDLADAAGDVKRVRHQRAS
jgi:hypothetical protein